MLFIKKDYDKALVHCLRVLETRSGSRAELKHGAQMMQMLLHFELGNLVFMESLCRNTIRAMKTEKLYGKFEQMFCTYIKKLVKTPNAELKSIFQEMFDDFLNLKKEVNENIYVLMSETLAWCKSKIENRLILETIYYKYD